MQPMRMFIDTHDKANGTFPEELSAMQLKEFYAAYHNACIEEGVISLEIHSGLKEGRAFCINLAPSADAVYRVHQKVGLPYDTITEVKSISACDLLNT